MKFRICHAVTTAVVLVAMSAAFACAQPLYEQYLNTPRETLQAETSKMSRELRATFNETAIRQSQQRIDFADYYANFKKVIFYGDKLANYAEYEENLAFARDRELFRGLATVGAASAGAPAGAYSQRAFVDEKFEMMRGNVIEEIETYTDLIIISLNACDILIANDLSGFSATRESRDTIRRYMDESEVFHVHARKFDRLEKSWPDLARRISAQVRFWESLGGKMPGDPIIDPSITGAIL